MVVKEKMSLKKQMFLQAFIWGVLFIFCTVRDLDFIGSDIRDFTLIIGTVILLIAVGWELKEKEKLDESAKLILGKVDGKCLRILVIFMLIVEVFIDDTKVINFAGVANLLTLLVFIIYSSRAILFNYYDRKGIVNRDYLRD